MTANVSRRAMQLDLEEKILNGASFVALVCVFLPWFGGEWLGGELVTHTGLGFYTSVIGLAVLFLQLLTLLITIIPVSGGPHLIKRHNQHIVRLICSGLSVALLAAAWSVLTLITFDFSRMEVHYGLYGCLIGSIVALLYSFLLWQEQHQKEVQGLFHQSHQSSDASYASTTTPEPPPADEHRIHP